MKLIKCPMCSRVFKYDNYSKVVVDAWTNAKLSSIERIRIDKQDAMKRFGQKLRDDLKLEKENK